MKSFLSTFNHTQNAAVDMKTSEKAKDASRKTRTKTSANVLLHVNTNSEVKSYKVRKK